MSGLYGTPVIAPAAIKTVILEDGDGNSLTAVVTGEETVFTATDNDVREGKTYASDCGVSTGTKDIPLYHTTTGVRVIPANAEFKIAIPKNNRYDYSELQAMTMPYKARMDQSVLVDRVVINDNVYNIGSSEIVSTVTKNISDKSIDFGITNGDIPSIIRFFSYKEEL